MSNAPLKETPDDPPIVVLPKTANHEESYTIPLRYRKMENLHIVFWLFKDISWCLGIRPIGILMIIPTLFVSALITWRTRQFVSELCHNIAITVWILANSNWGNYTCLLLSVLETSTQRRARNNVIFCCPTIEFLFSNCCVAHLY